MNTGQELAYVVRIYEGSDGEATRAMYDRLTKLGAIGTVAVNLFRAQKTSSRAKSYRRGSHKGASYDRKQWSLENLAKTLVEHGEALGIRWGWGSDPEQSFHKIVLYVDLPTGQVSFHTADRGLGPDYPDEWDGIRGASSDRICRWVARVLAQHAEALAPCP